MPHMRHCPWTEMQQDQGRGEWPDVRTTTGHEPVSVQLFQEQELSLKGMRHLDGDWRRHDAIASGKISATVVSSGSSR